MTIAERPLKKSFSTKSNCMSIQSCEKGAFQFIFLIFIKQSKVFPYYNDLIFLQVAYVISFTIELWWILESQGMLTLAFSFG